MIREDDDTRIVMTDGDGNRLDLTVVEETKINGMYYLLAADEEENCYILKDISRPEDTEAVYEFVTDDDEYDYMYRIFKELTDGSGVELSE
jgi:hypothetical protein